MQLAERGSFGVRLDHKDLRFDLILDYKLALSLDKEELNAKCHVLTLRCDQRALAFSDIKHKHDRLVQLRHCLPMAN